MSNMENVTLDNESAGNGALDLSSELLPLKGNFVASTQINTVCLEVGMHKIWVCPGELGNRSEYFFEAFYGKQIFSRKNEDPLKIDETPKD